jgi:hypothetical protein
MKRIMLSVTMILALLVLTAGVAASSVTRLRVSIPFDFNVGAKQLQAGQYIFAIGAITTHDASASSVAVLTQDGIIIALIPTMPGWDAPMNDDHLHFNRYGDRYFLSKVECAGYQANLRVTRTEKEARAENVRDRGTIRLALLK